MNAIRKVLYKNFVQGVLESSLLDKEDGGPDCHSEMDLSYKLTINIILSQMNIFILSKLYERVVPKINGIKDRGSKARRYEIACGLACWVIIIIQIYYKFSTQSLIFMLNPCHLSMVK